jgi:hypothetical protein
VAGQGSGGGGSKGTIVLESGAGISQSAAIDALGLAVRAAGSASLNVATNQVDFLSANTGDALTYVDTDDFTVTVVDGLGGITTDDGAIDLTVTADESPLVVNSAIDAGIGTAGITLSADKLSLNASVDAAAGIVTIVPTDVGEAIYLGADDDSNATAETLELTDAELDLVTADTLRIGATNAGGISIRSAISPALVTNLSLITDEGVLDNGVTSGITVSGLAIDADTEIDLSGVNDVDRFAAVVADPGQQLVYTGDGFRSRTSTASAAIALTR